MANLTRSLEDQSKFKLNNALAFQAANGAGDNILEEMLKFSKDQPYVLPKGLTYNKASKCWTDHKGKIVIFNIAEDPSKAITFVQSYLNGEASGVEKTDVTAAPLAGVLATDTGKPLSLDPKAGEVSGKTTALKVDSKNKK